MRALGVRDIGMNAAGRTIVLEGAADYHYLLSGAKSAARKYPELLEKFKPLVTGSVRLFPAHGARSFKMYAPNLLSENSGIVFLADGDDDGKSAISGIKAGFKNHPGFKAAITLPEIFQNPKSPILEIEDLFGEKEYLKVAKTALAHMKVNLRRTVLELDEKKGCLGKQLKRQLAEKGVLENDKFGAVATAVKDLVDSNKLTLTESTVTKFSILADEASALTIAD